MKSQSLGRWSLLSQEKATFSLGAYLPDGFAFMAKNIAETNLYKLLDACAKSFVLFTQTIDDVHLEMNPATTEDLIARWEKEYGMGKSCFGIADTLEQRRANLLIRIGADGIQTMAEFKAFIISLGFPCNLITGTEFYKFPLAFPWHFMAQKRAKFTLIVQLAAALRTDLFPFTATKFPFPFSSGQTNIVECWVRKLVPANVEADFQYVL